MKNFLLALRRKEDVVNTVVAIASAKVLIQKSNEEHLKLIELEKFSWANTLLTPFHSWSSKKGCTNFSRWNRFQNQKISNTKLANIEYQPNSFQAGTNFKTHLSRKKSKHVSIAGSSYKQTITRTFGITFSNVLLSMQLIYGEKSNKVFQNLIFPNHWA